MSLTDLEKKALKQAHRAMAAVLPLDEGNFHGASFTRVSAALFGRCSGIEAGGLGPRDEKRREEIAALVTSHMDEGFLSASAMAGAA